MGTMLAMYVFMRAATDASVRHAGIGPTDKAACSLYLLSAALFTIAARGKFGRIAIVAATGAVMFLLFLDLQ
jgi:hypothetical protein